MTLARTAVRLSVVNALTGATLAGLRVYDSQIVDFDPEVYMGAGEPAITILSDEDNGEALSDQNGGPPFRRMIKIVVEISILQAIPLEGEINPDTGSAYPAGAFRILCPDTDARCESSLDFIEFQVIQRLSYDLHPLCELFRSFNRITKAESHRQTADETAQKIASRVLEIECDTQDDDSPRFLRNGIDTAPVGIAALPEPLQSVCASFAVGSEGYKTCMGIAAAIVPIGVTPLAGVDFIIDGATGVDNNHSDEVRVTTNLPQS